MANSRWGTIKSSIKLFGVWVWDVSQEPTLEFGWQTIEEFDFDEEAMTFNFLYARDNKKSRWVKIMTSYVSSFNLMISMYSNRKALLL